jgi:carbamoyl-phosphate synthase large subunit
LPRRRDLHSVCLIGSGPIVIGQACEFDYAGSQALKVLREDGFRTIVVNSNPATIMTDPGFADRTYLEPLDLDGVADVLGRERPDALLPTLGGQTALNLAMVLGAEGVLDALGIELIGAGREVIRHAEDRELFRATVRAAGLKVPESLIVTAPGEVPDDLSFPVILRPAFTLGGHGGGTARSRAEFEPLLDRALRESPVRQVLVEESLLGWDEFELEVMRDRRDNVVIVCSIENLDPMGVHTGDSVTVAPQMTLSDEAYQELRDAAAAVIRAVGLECGGSNIQFARDRESGELRVIEMNPRVSRSSALASKATGYPIAKVAAKLAVGYTLDEIPNDLTGTTPASFEPTLDYVVVKAPRFAFEKFPGAETALGTQMKSVGEAMGIGRSFSEAFLKALRSRELDGGAVTPWAALDRIPAGVHPWFRHELERVREALERVHSLDDLVADDWLRLKRLGLSDAAIAAACGRSEETARAKRRACGVKPAFRRVDSCAGEVEAGSNYFYSSWGEADEAIRPRRGKLAVPDEAVAEGRSLGPVLILGSGPNRIGQGIEFDYCCVHAAKTFRELGYEAVMVNCNPETVSTDYDTSDRLYFEPLGVEEVLSICERERPVGIVTQFGGQTPLRLARPLEQAGHSVLGTSPEAIDLAEDRERFAALLDRLGIRCPAWGTACNADEAVTEAQRIGYPVLVRPSYVLGGRAMRVCYAPDEVRATLRGLGTRPRVLLDRFVEQALELDVDALCDGTDTYVAAVMQHVEEAGVHSGDSACVLPAPSLSPLEDARVREVVRELGAALGVVGLLNVQLAIADGGLYVLEVNPRASRTVPFASKATGINLVAAACRLAAGARLAALGLPADPTPSQVSVKAAVLPFARFPGADPVLGPEMRATGEVMATAADFPTAFAKAERAAGRALPTEGTAFISVCDAHKGAIVPVAQALAGLGFDLLATAGTAHVLAAAGLAVDFVRKVTEAGEGPTVVDLIRRGRCDLVINTPHGSGARTDGYLIREAALIARVPCITTISGAAAAVEAIAHAQPEISISLQERIQNGGTHGSPVRPLLRDRGAADRAWPLAGRSPARAAFGRLSKNRRQARG